MTITEHELLGDLRAGDAEGLRAALMTALEAGDLRVTTTGVASADMAAVQVLLSAKRTAAQLGRTVEIDLPEGGVMSKLLSRLALAGEMVS